MKENNMSLDDKVKKANAYMQRLVKKIQQSQRELPYSSDEQNLGMFSEIKTIQNKKEKPRIKTQNKNRGQTSRRNVESHSL